MKKLLILGANPETSSLVIKAKQMGYYTIVTDYNPNAYAKSYADLAINIDASDVDLLERFAIDNNVNGIVVGVAEALLPAYCELCSRLNLPCFSSREVFEIMSNKAAFKRMCRAYGVPTIQEYKLEHKESIQFPVIVKPVDSCSSKGITIAYNNNELMAGIESALNFSKCKEAIIEKYMVGDEVISYYIIQDGTPIFVGMCDRYTFKQNGLVQLPISYIFPSRYIDSYLEKTDKPIKDFIKKMGLKNGSIFFQCFVDEHGIVRVYEPGYRLNGAQEHILTEQIMGIDAKELYINFSISGQVSNDSLLKKANPKHAQYACKLSPLVKPGTIGKIGGIDKIITLSDVISINGSYHEGDTVEGLGTLKQIVCRFFIVSNSKEELIDTIKAINEYYSVENTDGENMLLSTFNPVIIETLY